MLIDLAFMKTTTNKQWSTLVHFVGVAGILTKMLCNRGFALEKTLVKPTSD